MKERGQLIRQTLVGELRDELPAFASDFGRYANDMNVEGSDGIGRKTEAPWTRIYATKMSPSAREGFYIVFHFAADGSAVFVTVGCGSTIWKDGDLSAISDEELASKTSWARQVIIDRWKTLDPFSKSMSLGAKADLPRTFEKATAISARIPFDDIEDDAVRHFLSLAIPRLIEIYDSQNIGRDVSPGEEAANEIAVISRPIAAAKKGQGFSLSSTDRKAIEIRAMELAMEWLKSNGYAFSDKSATQSYDFLASQSGIDFFVEVKGTTSDECQTILMTRNEIDLHRKHKGKTALIIVSKIRLDRTKSPPSTSGGAVEVFWGWDIDEWRSEPIAFQLFR